MSRIIMHRKLEHQLKYQTYQLILSTFYFTALHGSSRPNLSSNIGPWRLLTRRALLQYSTESGIKCFYKAEVDD